MRRAGEPTTSANAGTSATTVLPAPTNAPSLMTLPQTIVAFAPMVAPRCTLVDSKLFGSFLKAARGFRSLVKTANGPTNTSSSIVT